MTTFGPFASLQSERLVTDLLGDDETAREQARLILSHHVDLHPGIAPQLRNVQICKLAALIKSWEPEISDNAVNVSIESALHERQGCRYLNRFSAEERRAIAKQANEIRLWMMGKKTTLDAKEIGNIITAAL